MNEDLFMEAKLEVYHPNNIIRVVTATSLFDGHDASINIMRRLLQSNGCEVIHLGHNRSAQEVVQAALQEDVQAIALSSYQGGHMEYFKYIRDLLNENGASHIKMFGGGGGVIVPEEINELHQYGITRIYSPEDGRRMGIQGIINDLVKQSDFSPLSFAQETYKTMPDAQSPLSVARWMTVAELKSTALEQLNRDEYWLAHNNEIEEFLEKIKNIAQTKKEIPVVGITGTGGAGKSSLIDELIRRWSLTFPKARMAIFSIDPTRKKTGGALLGDRIRMNFISSDRVFMRSLATRQSENELSASLQDAVNIARAAGFDIVVVETSGIGQADSAITRITSPCIYVMTSEYGAGTQLEKIEMLDVADVIVINKFDRRGAEDALRDVSKQYIRNHELDFLTPREKLPIFPTCANRFNDLGVNKLFLHLVRLVEKDKQLIDRVEKDFEGKGSLISSTIIPDNRINYLGEIAAAVRKYHRETEKQVAIVRRRNSIKETLAFLEKEYDIQNAPLDKLKDEIKKLEGELDPKLKDMLNEWQSKKAKYNQNEMSYFVRGKEKKTNIVHRSLSGLNIPKVKVPDYTEEGEIVRFLRKENLPGEFPYTAGVFPFKRTDEDPKRQFAGEGTPERTNRRFHYLSRNDAAKRLSTAFDSVTLYGEDPDERPDIYGKIGEGGVSICTLEDAKKLYSGFDLCHPNTSVSMTINGPASIMLAFFFNTAIDQQVEKWTEENGRKPNQAEYEEIRDNTLKQVRGTVQADILKEDQAQNTCIFSIDFALKLMGDIQEFLIEKQALNYYSVSISGYHMAEAGATPVSQLSYTLANGFTYVEYYLSRGMHINDFAPNLSFFFSNGLEPEYAVIGRVARRIWAIAMHELYKGNERAQKLKYHIQTSGRSLHAQEIDFNDIRTTLQAILAIYDNCNSLHTNSYDEAITTPTEESVRRAMAIQLIILREFGNAKNENINQGSYYLEWLTDMVEEIVLQEFEQLNRRGGVLGSMETMYQRGKIQEESMYYELKKSSGEYPIIGVNTYVNPKRDEEGFEDEDVELARATNDEKDQQVHNVKAFQKKNENECEKAIKRLKEVALANGNIFREIMETVKVASLGQITHALYEVGGKYRRNM